MQIKTTMRNHLPPVRMALSERKEVSVGEIRMWRKENLCALLVGMQIGITSVKNSVELPQKIKNRTTIYTEIHFSVLI